jgi:hypothetical protein
MDTQKDDEIDLIALLKTVFVARRFVIKTTILFAVLGIILAVVSPTKYTASSTFVPQLSEGQTNSPLGGLASLAGINVSAIMGGQPQEISPSLYPQIAESVPYRLALLDATVEIKHKLSGLYFITKWRSGNFALIEKIYHRPSWLVAQQANRQ